MTAPRLLELRLRDWRCHDRLTLAPGGCPWVVLAGDNGAGKTSVLEAIYAIARGRSFRTATLPEVIATGRAESQAFLRSAGGVPHVMGVGVRRAGRELHLDGVAGASLAQTAEALPVEYVSGDAYQLIGGPPTARRRFMDWALFHVEPRFFEIWKDWHRAHRQRNALLRRGAPERDLLHWTPAVVGHGERLSAMRQSLSERLNERLAEQAGTAWLGRVRIGFRRGWRDPTLSEAFRRTAAREIQAGRAVVGPQYDDWRVTAGGLEPATMSRGQAKLVSFLLYLAQTRLLREARKVPLLLIDDLTADLDARAVRSAIDLLSGEGAQIWLSVLPENTAIALPGSVARFHVEPGGAVAA